MTQKAYSISDLTKWWRWYEKSGFNVSELVKKNTKIPRSTWQKRIAAARLRLNKKSGKIIIQRNMTESKAKRLLSIYEANSCKLTPTAITLGIGIQTCHSQLVAAKIMMKWVKPEKQPLREDEGIDRQYADELYNKIRKGGLKVRKYVVTSAQNATPVNTAFLKSLLTYCKHNNAQLLIVPYRYKNPTSAWTKQDQNLNWWDKAIMPYIIDKRVLLNKNLMLMADIKIQPTAVSPLSGNETMSRGCSAIFGHPKIELTTIATPQNKLPKILTTTGSITKQNYTWSKAGKKGEHHHTFGAVAVDIKGGLFHIRQINAINDGSFMDLNKEYTGSKVKTIKRVSALIMGDTHTEVADPSVVKATFGPGGLVDFLKPETLVWHDLHDFYARNHHHRGRVFINYVKHHTNRDNVKKYLDESFDFVNKYTPKDTTNVFVYSNHPDALRRWVEETDPRSDPENLMFWAETAQMMGKGSKWAPSGAKVPDPFAYWGKKKLGKPDINIFLHPQQSYMVKGIEVGYHGDFGPNGSRGTRKGFSRIGVKVVIGHGHSPGITEGAFQVGTTTLLDLEYVKGPSSWLHTHCIIYPNGKRSLVNIIEGHFKT
jgi:hypothetical protein